MNMQAQENYLRTQINTASPSELTLMLFNGCVKFLKQAQIYLQNRNYEQKNLYIHKARDIIDELNLTLDMRYDLSSQLRALYHFINEQLAKANMKNDPEALQVSLDLVSELRDTWAEAMKKAKTQEKAAR